MTHESDLEREIYQQPDVLRRLISEGWDRVGEVAQAVREYSPKWVWMAARGSSDNAARYAQYLFGINVGLAVGLATPSVHTLYGRAPGMDGALVVGISQSGRSVGPTQVVRDAREQGALTLAITNDPGSPLAQAAQYHIALRAGEERSLAATKTYTAQLTVLAMLGAFLSGEKGLLDAIRNVPDWVAQTLDANAHIMSRGERYRFMTHCVVIGRGYNYATAFEIALKLKELTYVVAEPYSSADFRHGPIAVVDRGFPTLIIAPNGPARRDVESLIEELDERHADLAVIANDDELLSLAHFALPIPEPVPDWLSPIVSVIPGQMLAWTLARVRSLPLDRPRGLKKVTITV